MAASAALRERKREMISNHSYRAEKKSLQILLSSTQAGPGRKVKQEQEEISRNHVQAFIPGSVLILILCDAIRSLRGELSIYWRIES